MKESIKLILGTMTFGEQIFGEDVKCMIQSFLSRGYTELDTAYVYNGGECERLLGMALEGVDRTTYKIATKANPRITGKLDREAVVSQLNESLKRLNADYVDTLYLHFPDPETPVMHTNSPRGIFTLIFFRLFSRAPLMVRNPVGLRRFDGTGIFIRPLR